MTNPKHAVETDNGRYYKDPATGDMLISVTNTLKAINKPALVPAAVKETTNYVINNLPRIVRRVRTDRDTLIKEIKAQHKNIWDSARDLGTDVHTYAEAEMLGTPMPPNDEVAPFIRQYQEWMRAWKVTTDHVEATECTVLHRDYEYAGTADLWVWLHAESLSEPPWWQPSQERKLWLVDFKSSRNPTRPVSAVYEDWVFQLAALRHAKIALAPDDTEFPVPDFEGAAVLNLRPNAHALIPVPATEQVFDGFLGFMAASLVLHELKPQAKTWKPATPPAPTAREGAA